ncbi:hypothetical protein J6590_019197 [Homalodisca vitripennis]|nr:hypothetical protein J6590_019197 [Homalodisca vitripennis]
MRVVAIGLLSRHLIIATTLGGCSFSARVIVSVSFSALLRNAGRRSLLSRALLIQALCRNHHRRSISLKHTLPISDDAKEQDIIPRVIPQYPQKMDRHINFGPEAYFRTKIAFSSSSKEKSWSSSMWATNSYIVKSQNWKRCNPSIVSRTFPVLVVRHISLIATLYTADLGLVLSMVLESCTILCRLQHNMAISKPIITPRHRIVHAFSMRVVVEVLGAVTPYNPPTGSITWTMNISTSTRPTFNNRVLALGPLGILQKCSPVHERKNKRFSVEVMLGMLLHNQGAQMLVTLPIFRTQGSNNLDLDTSQLVLHAPI